MYQVKIKIEGIVPLLMNRYPLPESRQGKRAFETEKPEEIELELKAYKDKRGMYMPVDCIRMMLIGNQARQGAAEILGSQIESKKGTWYKNFCNSFVFVIALDDPLNVYFEPKRKTWDDVDCRSYMGKIGKTVRRNLIIRPQINNPWSLTFGVDVYDDQLPASKLKQLFDVAGLRCGCGNYGPTFGRFLVKEFEKTT